MEGFDAYMKICGVLVAAVAILVAYVLSPRLSIAFRSAGERPSDGYNHPLTFINISHDISLLKAQNRRFSLIHASPLNYTVPGFIFIKTHKTASTTLHGILWRALCERLRLKCFLPSRKNAGRTWDLEAYKDWKFITKEAVSTKDNNGIPFDAWLQHVRYNQRLYSVVPSAARMFSIVRHPVQRFSSAWHWYNLEANTHLNFSSFIRLPVERARAMRMFYRTGLDATTEELTGMERSRVSEIDFHKAFLKLIRRVLSGHLILFVTERFDESVLLLGYALNNMYGHVNPDGCHERIFTLRDLLYIKQKVADNQKKFIEDDTIKLTELQPYDTALYEVASHTLDLYLQAYREDSCNNDESFEDLMSKFQALVGEVEQACKDSALAANATLHSVCVRLSRDNRAAVEDAWLEKQRVH